MYREIYDTYAPETDQTFIMEDIIDEQGDIKSTQVVGWYYGGPNDEDTMKYYGKIKATF